MALWGVQGDGVTFDHRHLAILAFEGQRWRYPGAKDGAIRDTFDTSPTLYYRALGAILDMPEAMLVDAALVARLRRLRRARAAARAG